MRLTVGQAVVSFLAAQRTEADGELSLTFAGCLGIFGHGNVAGLGQALLQSQVEGDPTLPYLLVRNEQAMVHTAAAYARATRRRRTWACTASIGPGSTNMVTGAAAATINRLPVLLLPSSTFATRASGSVLQQLESPVAGDVTVNDAFRPVSRWYDEIRRPEQLPSALLEAMRVLTDPVETGAVTLSLPQDVQAEVFDWPDELFAERVWHVGRPPAEESVLDAAAEMIRAARRPLVVAGGGVHYSEAEGALAQLCAATGIPVVETQAGKGSLLHGDPHLLGAVGSTGTSAATELAAEADLVIGVGTRWSDFTTASRTLFAADDVRFVNVNVARLDGTKHAGLPVVADAREALRALRSRLQGWRVDDVWVQRGRQAWAAWEQQVEVTYDPPADVTDALEPGVLTQGQVLGVVNEFSDPTDVVVCAAGSMPGDLHRLWRVRDHLGYHVEYGYSCMGYEIPGGLGVKLAQPERDVIVLVGDGSYLMNPTELVTCVQEGVALVVVVVQNHGFASIGSLSESVGSLGFGTRYRRREDGWLNGDVLPVDLAANAASLGATVADVHDRAELVEALARAKRHVGGPFVIHARTDPSAPTADGGAWWDVPVAAESRLESTRDAHEKYLVHKQRQRSYLSPPPTIGSTDPPD